ncbi:hypothetical protein EI94DRAFT_79720 [Lactarius quietus]|nr:hypothetical protein EI94DRAFT_79720 [Lactarius quietus]
MAPATRRYDITVAGFNGDGGGLFPRFQPRGPSTMFLPLLVLSSYLLLLIDPLVHRPPPRIAPTHHSTLGRTIRSNKILALSQRTRRRGLCTCNTVFCNPISTCDACQGSSWIAYSKWSFNCTSIAKASPGTFPEPIPAGAPIPKWAYFDSSFADSWNLTEAEAIGGSEPFYAVHTPAYSSCIVVQIPPRIRSPPTTDTGTQAARRI